MAQPAKPPKPREKPRLIPQPHGGALRNGGTNRGGPGRPPSAVREMCRKAFEEGLPEIVKIATGKIEASAGERVRALDILGKYGLGTQQEVSGSIETRRVTVTVRDEGT